MRDYDIGFLRRFRVYYYYLPRFFASLKMTGLDFTVVEELSRSLEPCLSIHPWLM